MLKHLLLIAILASIQIGCTLEEDSGMYQPYSRSSESMEVLEQLKRGFLQLEEIKIGDGPVAALGRKVEADIDVRYADGTVVYQGPSTSYFGMQGDVFIHNNVGKNGVLAYQQRGIMLGLNGMAVGGKRRIIIHPKLVCEGYGAEEPNPKISCSFVIGSASVRKEKLIVEATLTASCTPIFLYIPLLYSSEVWCRDSQDPTRSSNDPIWRMYQAPPVSH